MFPFVKGNVCVVFEIFYCALNITGEWAAISLRPRMQTTARTFKFLISSTKKWPEEWMKRRWTAPLKVSSGQLSCQISSRLLSQAENAGFDLKPRYQDLLLLLSSTLCLSLSATHWFPGAWTTSRSVWARGQEVGARGLHAPREVLNGGERGQSAGT